MTIPFDVLTLDDGGMQPFINGHVDGKSVRLIIDSGASRSIISDSFVKNNFQDIADQAGINVNGAGIGETLDESFKSVVAEFVYNKYSIEKYEIVIIDLNHINVLFDYLGLQRIDGLIGSDLLNYWNAEIDYASFTSYEILSPDEFGCQIIVTCFVNGKPFRFIIDTGASKTVMDIQSFKSLPDTCDMKVNETPVAGLSSSSPVVSEFFAENLKFGDCVIYNQLFYSMDLSNINRYYTKSGLPEIDGLIGGDILFGNSAIIDYKNKILKLKI